MNASQGSGVPQPVSTVVSPQSPAAPRPATVSPPVSQTVPKNYAAVPTAPVKTKRPAYITVGIVLASIACLFGIAWLINAVLFTNTVEVSQQSVVSTVHISRLQLKRGSFLVIFKFSGDEGLVPIANSPYLDPDTYENFDIPIYTPKMIPESGDELRAIVYDDVDHNRNLSYPPDAPTRNIFGLVDKVRFKAL